MADTNSRLNDERVVHSSLPQVFARFSLWGAVTFSLFWCVVSLWFPFGWDQGMLAAVGDVIVRDGMAYRDGWEMKGPLTYYFFAITQWLFGRTMWGLRLLDIILLLSASAALVWLVTRLTTLAFGIWAAVAYIIWYSDFTWFHTIQPDGWVGMLLLIGFAPLLSGSSTHPLKKLALASFIVGTCGLVKPFFLAFGLVPLVTIFGRERLINPTIQSLGVIILASATPVVTCIIWYYLNGALPALIDVHLDYALHAYSGVNTFSLQHHSDEIFKWLWRGRSGILLPVIAIGLYMLLRKHPLQGRVLLAWLLIAIGAVALQGKFYIYHWHPVLPPMIIAGSFGLWSLFHYRAEHITGVNLLQIFVFIALLMFLVPISIIPATRMAQWGKYQAGLLTKMEYYEGFSRWKYNAGDEIRAAKYIQLHSAESDKLAVMGNDSTVGFLSGRASPTRFIHSMALTRGSDPWKSSYRKEYIEHLEFDPPLYFIMGMPYTAATKTEVLDDFPELKKFLTDNYHLEKSIGMLDIYRLNETVINNF